MTVFMIDPETGLEISVRGYAARYSSLSLPLRDLDGRREIISRGAFTEALRRGNIIPLRIGHMPHPILGATNGALRIWEDRFGLAFELTRIVANSANRWAVNAIVRSELRGCSFQLVPQEVREEDLGAAGLVRVVRKVASLPHITLADQPAYEGTGVWVSHEQLFPGHLNQLREDWQRGRSAGLGAVKARKRPQQRFPRLVSKAKPKAMRRAAPFTDQELLALAQQEAHARRMMGAHGGRRRPRAA
jgi:HK97 family phage prohead protease